MRMNYVVGALAVFAAVGIAAAGTATVSAANAVLVKPIAAMTATDKRDFFIG